MIRKSGSPMIMFQRENFIVAWFQCVTAGLPTGCRISVAMVEGCGLSFHSANDCRLTREQQLGISVGTWELPRLR